MCRAIVLLFSIALGGCIASADPQPTVSSASWNFDGRPGRILCTDHYRIYTTLTDDGIDQRLAELMEAAFSQYRQIAPNTPISRSPMNCYVFARREQWATFTKQQTGAFAPIYLKINRGGYTVDDRFVAYYMGDHNTFVVAAHEGWHQFVARNFQTRLPPFLEEGLATVFENVQFIGGSSPVWDLSTNPDRAGKIRGALEQHTIWPLTELCRMHAGMVVGLSGARIESFYAEDWAFAQFLLHGDGGRYRAALRLMLTQMADGSACQWNGLPPNAPPGAWNPASAGPLLEHYLLLPMPQIEERFASFLQSLAYASVRTTPAIRMDLWKESAFITLARCRAWGSVRPCWNWPGHPG